MGDSSKQICWICLDKTPADECESIDQIKKEKLETLLININFDISDDAVACNGCQQKLQDTFDFKSRYTGIFLDPDSTADKKVSLKNCQKCRLCMSLIGDKDFNYSTDFRDGISLQDVIGNCFPEMDLSIVHEPLICKSCISGLKRYYELMESCRKAHLAHGTAAMVKIEGTLKSKYGDEADELVPFKEECPDAVSEVNDTVCLEPKDHASIKYEEVYIKGELDIGEEMGDSVPSGVCKNSGMSSISKWKRQIRKSITKGRKSHERSEQELDQREKCAKFKCEKCPYETDFKSYLRKHNLNHKDKSEVEMHKCEYCEFQTRYKSNIAKHMLKLKHRDPKAEKKFKCGECPYETDFKSCLDKHNLIHKDKSEVAMHKCDNCEFETRQKCNLIRHMLTHRDPEVEEKFKCGKCPYESDLKSLRKHNLIHKEMLKCENCEYESTYKCNIIKHNVRKHGLMIHKDKSEVEMSI